MATEMLMEISQDEAERARFLSRKKFEFKMDMRSDTPTAKAVYKKSPRLSTALLAGGLSTRCSTACAVGKPAGSPPTQPDH